MPEVEAKLNQFQEQNTQVLGVSVDTVFCHANWGSSLGGVSFPLLADFHPKGAMAKEYGLYLESKGIGDRATVIIDAAGVVQYAESAGPAGQRNIDDLVKACAEVNSNYKEETTTPAKAEGIKKCTLYIKNKCGFSRAVLLARTNLHLENQLNIKNVSTNASAIQELKEQTGKDQAPCLAIGDKTMLESSEIIEYLTKNIAPIA